MTRADLVSTNTTDCSVVFAIDGQRWEYFLATPHDLWKVQVLNKCSGLKALNIAKQLAIRQRRLDHAA